MVKKKVISKERQVNAYAIMADATYSFLNKAKKIRKGSYYQIMGSLIFTAFTLEAYLNHLGEKLFKYWDYFEKLSPSQKLDIITDELEVKRENGNRPFQTIIGLFRFRNAIAHGKSVYLKSATEIKCIPESDNRNVDYDLETKWEKYCFLKNAERAMKDVEEIIKLLNEKAGIKNGRLFGQGISQYLTTPKNEERGTR